MTSLRRLVVVGVAAVGTLLGVMAVVPDVTAASIIRLGVFALLVLLLMWARAMSEAWQRESTEARSLAASIAENAPVGFGLYDRQSLRCLYANEVATHHGLDVPDQVTLTPFGERSPSTSAVDLLAEMVVSEESLPPTLYTVDAHQGDPRFLCLGVTIHTTGLDDALRRGRHHSGGGGRTAPTVLGVGQPPLPNPPLTDQGLRRADRPSVARGR